MSLDRRGRLVVYPIAESWHAAPVRVLDADVSDAALGAALREALAARVDPGSARDAHGEELRRLGLSLGELDSGPSASVYPERKRLSLVGWDAKGFPTGEERTLAASVSDEELGAAVRGLLGGTPRIEGPVGSPFGYKVAWVAVRGSDPTAVADALGLERREAVSWEDGVERSSAGRRVFVSPRTGGWVFALCVDWGDAPPDLAALSERLETEVQYFATHRVVELHAWGRANAGGVERAVRVVGESGEQSASGEPTDAEHGLDLELVDEETVLDIAAAWSIDPRTLGVVQSEGETGTLGFLPKR